MKVATVVALVAAGSAPALAGFGVDWLGIDDVERVLHGENVTAVANDIARREFTPDATLEILETWDQDWTVAEWGGKLNADDDHVYRHVRVRLANDGRLDLAVHTSHFRAFDDANRRHRAEWGLQHLVDNPGLKPGDAEVGILVFHVPDHARLQVVEWAGAFDTATARFPDARAPGSGHAAADGAPATAGGADADARAEEPPHDADEYASHWE